MDAKSYKVYYRVVINGYIRCRVKDGSRERAERAVQAEVLERVSVVISGKYGAHDGAVYILEGTEESDEMVAGEG